MAQRWLFKTEPSKFSWEDLVREGRTVWDGVTNALALIHLRKTREGDPVIVYHTDGVSAAVGLAKIARGSYPDPKAGDGKLVIVDLVPVKPLGHPVTLAEMKETRALAGCDLLRLGRLSIVPISGAHWKIIMSMGNRGRG